MNETATPFAECANAAAIPCAEIPVLATEAWSRAIVAGVAEGRRVCALFGTAAAEPGTTRLHAVLADDRRHRLCMAATDIAGGAFDSGR